MPGVSWSQPREDDAKKKIKKFSTSKETPREWARDLGKKIREEYSVDSVNDKYSVALKGIV